MLKNRNGPINSENGPWISAFRGPNGPLSFHPWEIPESMMHPIAKI